MKQLRILAKMAGLNPPYGQYFSNGFSRFKFAGHRVVIYPDDHTPAHVHVLAAGNEAVYLLNCIKGPVECRENYGFSKKQLKHIEDALNARLYELCQHWRTIHE
jgi:Domain of unknown function (DUF4160)